MVLGTLGASLVKGKGKIRVGEDKIRLIKLVKIFNTASSCNKLWNTKVLSKWT